MMLGSSWLRRPVRAVFAALVAVAALACWAESATASKLIVLHRFEGANAGDGAYPYASLSFDRWGALHGTTLGGGDANCLVYAAPSACGTVFKLAPTPTAKFPWAYTVLHQFHGGTDGAYPLGAVGVDRSGAVYGAAGEGGNTGCGGQGCGTVFKLTPTTGPGEWTVSNIHLFAGSPDGAGPLSVAVGAAGSVGGVTFAGGGGGECAPGNAPNYPGCGVVYAMIPPPAGGADWTEKIIHRFSPTQGGDLGVDLLYSNNAIYGTAYDAGVGSGTVYRLTAPKTRSGAWSFAVIGEFLGMYGFGGPNGGLVMDKFGALYGTTESTVFKLSPSQGGRGKWHFVILQVFPGGRNGEGLLTGLVIDRSGALYGTTDARIFKLTPPPRGQKSWVEHSLYQFTGGYDGRDPQGRLIMDDKGRLFGTTTLGGLPNAPGCDSGCGTVFEFLP